MAEQVSLDKGENTSIIVYNETKKQRNNLERSNPYA